MTDPRRALLVAVVDRSGSMQACRADAEGGLNALLAEHRRYDAEHATSTELVLVQFDTQVETVHDGPLATFDRYLLRPRGSTALLDAVGLTVARVGEDLAARPEVERPGAVTLVVVTDGEENASREYHRDQVRELLTRQERDYAWQVLFLAANLDAVAEAATLGVAMDSALTFTPATAGAAYAAATTSSLGYRANRAAGADPAAARAASAFTDAQRRRADPATSRH